MIYGKTCAFGFFSLFSYVERNANTKRNGFNFYRHFYELHTWHFLAHLISIINVTTSKHIFNSCFCLRCLVKWNEQQKIKFIRNWISGWKIGRFGIWPRRGIQSNSPRKRINNADRALTKQIIWEIPLFFLHMWKVNFCCWTTKKKCLTANLFRHRIFFEPHHRHVIAFTAFWPCLCHSHSRPFASYTFFSRRRCVWLLCLSVSVSLVFVVRFFSLFGCFSGMLTV